MHYLLFLTIFVVATCGLIYELVAGTLASYLLGDSITQFSTVIGTYLFAMGVGSWLSKYIKENIIEVFIKIEILIGLIGGLSSAVLFLLFAYGAYFQFSLYFLVTLTGIFVGLEIPLIMRILNDKYEFKDLISKVFTFDYIGALLASIIFPILLVPYLNLIRTSALFGIFNVGLALYLVYFFRIELRRPTLLFIYGVIAGFVLLFAFVFSRMITDVSEAQLYGENVIFSKNSKYQRIAITRNRNAYCLYLNNHLQFNSGDEYRYHEALVHPLATSAKQFENILILGGGDGFVARECLKYSSVKSITLIDLDPELTKLFKTNYILNGLNKASLKNDKVTVHNSDAFSWLTQQNNTSYDAIFIDFPDPSNFSVGKLYTLTFFRLLQRVMHSNTKVVIQSTSPLSAKESFWLVNSTIRHAGLKTVPYHCYVPSFGEWGFIMFGYSDDLSNKRPLPEKLRFFSGDEFGNMRIFPRDMQHPTKEVNRLENQILISVFEREWGALY
jgi:spermidine synthase